MTVRGRVEAIEADITTLALDAIVNAANRELFPGGGVDGAIRKAAGRELTEHLYRIGRCEEGEAVLTPGYRLAAVEVIHTVAPVFGAEAATVQERVFARCYESALALADAHGIRTIAFPGIGTGVYRWPLEIASKIAFDAVVAHLEQCIVQTRVVFCCFSRRDRQRYQELLAQLNE